MFALRLLLLFLFALAIRVAVAAGQVRDSLPRPAALCGRIGETLARDLAALQPVHFGLREEGFALWPVLRQGLPDKEAALYGRSFDRLYRAHLLMLEAADAWFEFSDTRFALRLDDMWYLKRAVDANVRVASALLRQALDDCRSAAAPARQQKED
jgi:hypothetical protein